MNLKARLDLLRSEAGLAGSASTVAPATSVASPEAAAPVALRERLARFAGRAARSAGGGRRTRTAVSVSAEALAERLGGCVVAEHLVLVETLLPLHSTHGRLRLMEALQPLAPLLATSATSSPQVREDARPSCAQALDQPRSLFPQAVDGPRSPLPLAGEGLGEREQWLGARPAPKLLGIDTETTGLAGGTGTAAFMVGIAEAGADGVRLRQWVLTAFAGEAAMLNELERSLSSTNLLLSYNGKTFDLPLLRDRRRLQRGPQLPEPPHLDLLHPTRRLFRAMWPDCRLATAERHLLGLVRDDDLPGSEAPRAWRDYLAGGPPDDLGRVLRHNALDVLSLLLLGPVLVQALREPAAHGADPRAAANLWEHSGEPERALAVLEASRAQLDSRGELELAWALRRAGRWSEAAAIWERLAQHGCSEAVERLAKYHEHVRRDWSRALDYATRLDDGPEVRHRRDRLKRRLGTQQGQLDFS